MDNAFAVSPFVLDQPAHGLSSLAAPDWEVIRPVVEGAEPLHRMATVHRSLADWVTARARAQTRPVAFVGDCCQSIAMLAGLEGAGLDPIVVWLDAHGDFNTHETTMTGFLGGMPLAMLTGRGEQALLHAARLHPREESDIFLADARDLDPGERELLDRSWVRRPSIAALAAEIPADRPIYVHFDVDVLDTAYAPAMHYPVPGGPALETMRAMLGALAGTGRIVGVTITPWDVAADKDRRTQQVCMELVETLVGAAGRRS